MNLIVEKELDRACEIEGLSLETCKVIKILLNKKLNNEIKNMDLLNEIDNVYELIKGDLDEG